MSSNNFYRVLKVGSRYAVEMGWMEDNDGLDSIPAPNAIWFDTLESAMRYASSRTSEYGVQYEDSVDRAPPTAADHKHYWEFASVVAVPDTGFGGTAMMEVAYVICRGCGAVKKVEVGR